MSPETNTRFLPEQHLRPVEYRVIHTTLGRIRIQIPQLLKIPDYQSRLKKLIESFDFVTHVRLNSAAESIIVNYTENAISPAALKQKLITAIEQATNPNTPVSIAAMSVADPANSAASQVGLGNMQGQEENAQPLSVFLTPYEQEQVQEIKKWESKEPDILSNIAGKLFSPVNKIIDLIIPSSILGVGLKAAETINYQWQKDWEKLKQIAELEDYYQLKQAKLEFCDRLAERVEGEAVMLAGIEGGFTGIFDWVGEIADIPLSIGLSLQTIQRIGLCYGYSPQAQTERQFIWAILGIGTANTTEERRKALQALHNLQHVLYRQTIDDTIENSVEESIFESTIDSILKQAITNLTGEYSGQALPFVGVGLGVIVNRSVMSEVSVSARRAFQIRWLLENKKLSSGFSLLP